MLKNIKLLLSIVFFCVFIACNTTNNKPLTIAFNKDSSKIAINGIDEAGLYQLKSKLATDSAYQNLVSVFQTPSDDDSLSMEIEWKGALSLNNDTLLFTPNYPFIKQKVYLVETIINAKFATGEDIIKSSVGTQIKRQQKILKR